MESFWKNNPCSPSWVSSLSSWWNTTPPRLAEPGRYVFPIKPVIGILIRALLPGEGPLLTEFWHRYFTTSNRCKIYVPPDHIEACVKSGIWEVYIAIDQRTGIVVGSGVRRWIRGLHIYETVWPKGAMIDYFCVHPGFRKQGIGRLILGTLQNRGPVPLPPHLILWDGLHPLTPPISIGMYWVKEKAKPLRTSTSLLQLPRPTVWPPPTSKIYSEWKSSSEVTSWKTPSGGEVVVWNTFQRRVPDGAEICIVLYSSTDTSLEEFVQHSNYGVILTYTQPSTPGWSIDSPWQMIAYNCVASPGGQFPCLCM